MLFNCIQASVGSIHPAVFPVSVIAVSCLLLIVKKIIVFSLLWNVLNHHAISSITLLFFVFSLLWFF
jgi:hypothetical protein